MDKEYAFVVESTGPKGGHYLDLIWATTAWQAGNRLKLTAPGRTVLKIFEEC